MNNKVVTRLEELLVVPAIMENGIVTNEVVADCAILSCGCLISESLYNRLLDEGITTSDTTTSGKYIRCPTCQNKFSTYLADATQLRALFTIVSGLKESNNFNNINNNDAISDTSDTVKKKLSLSSKRRRSSATRRNSSHHQQAQHVDDSQKVSLLAAFHEIVSNFNNNLGDKDNDNTSVKNSYKELSTTKNEENLINTSSTSPSNVEDWIATINDSTDLKSFSKNSSSIGRQNDINPGCTNPELSPISIPSKEYSGTDTAEISNKSPTARKNSISNLSQALRQQAALQQQQQQQEQEAAAEQQQVSAPHALSSLASLSSSTTKPLTKSSSATAVGGTTVNTSSMTTTPLHRSKTNDELLFAKNFPFFKKQYQYSTHASKFFLKNRSTKLFINNDISPNLHKFVLLTEKKWEVYSMNPDLPQEAPELYCCGKNSGEYGINFSALVKSNMDDFIKNSNYSSKTETKDEMKEKLANWEHLFCKLSNNFLIIAGTRGILRVYDLNQHGKPIYTYCSKFPIRCIDISANEKFISLGITGKDKYTGSEQALIVLLKVVCFFNEDINMDNDNFKDTQYAFGDYNSLEPSAADLSLKDATFTQPKSTSREFVFRVDPITITLPYRDPINILQFSPNSQYLSCATALESRFMIISITDPNEPKLIMKSLRSLDTSLESEGITDLNIFPDNRLMVITSVAYNSSPIIIDTKVSSISNLQGIAQPIMLLRVSEVGSNIHKACVSPRCDAVAFLDRNGLVYLMSSPHMDDNENKRIVIVTEVSSAYRMKEAATIKFDKDGYKLFILDRKGVLYIEDFTAGSPQNHDITRCKLIS